MQNAVENSVISGQEKHSQGVRLYGEGLFNEAFTLLGEALKECRDAHPDFWNDWGVAALACGRADKAEDGFRRALTLNPQDVQAAANLGILLAGLNRAAEAIPFLASAAATAGTERRVTLAQLLAGCRNKVASEAVSRSQSAFRDLVVKGAEGKNKAAAASTPPVYSSAAERIRATGKFSAEDIELIVSIYNQTQCARGTAWDSVGNANLEVPGWFNTDLDPYSDEYADQQHKLWSLITGVERGYQPEMDEQEPNLEHFDAVRFPGFFRRRDKEAVESAADHIIAAGMILKHCGLNAGDTALEYGAGFAQAALSLARLGVSVDTVDISSSFCRCVKEQADFFNVPLTPFEGKFGWNPRTDHQYKLIFFYESFHHCLDFKTVVRDLKRHLASDGVVLLAGEPIIRTPHSGIPYPWGLRLHSEVIAVMRNKRWFELGFSEDFLVGLFTRAGFSAARMECPMSQYGDGYLFKHRGDSVDLATQWLPNDVSGNWHAPEAVGRWTKDQSVLPLDSTESFDELVVEASNYFPFAKSVAIIYGDSTHVTKFDPGEKKQVCIQAGKKASRLIFRSPTHVPGNGDKRALGILVHRVHYRRTP